MKLLTLNTHSLQEENYEQKLEWFVAGLGKERPDIIALQEVNQTVSAPLAESSLQKGQYPTTEQIPLRQDNHAAQTAKRLRQMGIDCEWAWLPVKRGYGKYDEGVALLSLGRKITAVEAFPVSKTVDYNNWRTRAVLGIQVEGYADWFYSIHLGWWDDEEEPFQEQWKKLTKKLDRRRKEGTVWLMGDFNAPDAFSDQSYACILHDGWTDTYQEAEKKDSGFTVSGIIDGWQNRLSSRDIKGLRLDHIWCSQKKEITSSRIMYNGSRGPIISDHFGVLVETREG